MTRHKDFGTGSSEISKDPVTFKLYGEEFSCRPAVQGKFFMDLAKLTASENELESVEAINLFFSKIMEDSELERFNKLLDDPEKIVSIETLGDIVSWLMEVYTDRPNQQPEN